MSHERRKNERVACRIPAAGPSGPAFIRDFSATGARVVSGAAVKIGERLPLRLLREDGRSIRLEGAVRRVRPRRRGGYEVGCSFEAHPESSVAAWRMAKSIAAGPVDFVPPPAAVRKPRHSWRLSESFSIEGLFFLAIGVTLLVVGSIVAFGYYGLCR